LSTKHAISTEIKQVRISEAETLPNFFARTVNFSSMLPGCVTSVEKSSGPPTSLRIEKVEDHKEERRTGREAEGADEVGVAGKGVEEAIPTPSEGSQKPQSGRKRGREVR
jgi:hypothetical protein